MSKQNDHSNKSTSSKLPPQVSPNRNSSSSDKPPLHRSDKINREENRKMEQEEQSENFGDNEGNF